MKRIIALLVTILALLTLPALAESGFPGVWIETEGYGTLTLFDDGTAIMEYYDGTVTENPWVLTDEGAKFTEGQWYNSLMVLLDDNTLSVSDGWMIFAREGFLPTTDETLLLGAEPVGEAGYPFCGKWVLEALVLEGETIDPAMMGISLELTLSSNGLATSYDGVDVYTTTWFESYGSAVVEGDVLVLNDEGKLVMEDAEGQMIFALVEAEVFEEDIPEVEIVPETEIVPDGTAFIPVSEEGAPFLGTWSLEMMDLGGMQMDPAMLGMTMTLTFNEDGSAVSDDGMEPFTAPWHMENGAAIVDGMALTINEEGKLILDDGESKMIFAKGEAAPAAELSEEEQMLALLALMMQMAETEESTGFDRLNTKFVCTSYSASGVTLDGATLGAEFGVIFHEDNTADLILAGYVMENLPYSITEEGVYAVNYYGTFFNCTPTDVGFDMDYYGTMTLHCAPAE